QERITSHRFPRTRLAHDPDRLFRLDIERDIVHRFHHSVPEMEIGAEIFDYEQRHFERVTNSHKEATPRSCIGSCRREKISPTLRTRSLPRPAASVALSARERRRSGSRSPSRPCRGDPPPGPARCGRRLRWGDALAWTQL